MKKLTQENAAQHIGMTITSSRPRFHHYPLRVFRGHDGYYVADRVHVAYLIPTEKEGGIPYDSESPTEKGEIAMNELEKVLYAIEDQQKKLGDGPVYWVGEQLKDILRQTPEAAQVVLEDFAAGHTVKDCEKQIGDYARKHGGCCPPKEADHIIREFFGIAGLSAGTAPVTELPADRTPEEKHHARRSINLADFM